MTQSQSAYRNQVESVLDYFTAAIFEDIHDIPTSEIVEDMRYTQWHVPGIRDDAELAELIDGIKAEHKAGTLIH